MSITKARIEATGHHGPRPARPAPIFRPTRRSRWRRHLSPPRMAAPRWSPRFTAVAVTVVIAASAALAVTAARGGDASDSAAPAATDADAHALAGYILALEPLRAKGGEVVQLGLKAGVTDIGHSRYDDVTLASMADAWVDDLEAVRDGFAGAPVPAFASEAHWLYGMALDEYVATAELLRATVEVDPADRQPLATLAAHMGERADDLYDRADRAIDRHRRRLGLTEERLGQSVTGEENLPS